MTDTVSSLAQKLRPFWLRDFGASIAPTTGASTMISHALNGPWHTGTIDEAQAPWAVPTSRTISAGEGLTGGGDLSLNRTLYLSSGVAGWGLSYAVGVISVGVANTGATGLSVEADQIRLTSSSDVSGGSSQVLCSLMGELSLGTLYSKYRVRSPLIDTEAATNLTLQPTGDLIIDPAGFDVLPAANYEINLGALTMKYLTLHAAELWVETLVAQSTIATIGGRILVGPTTTLTRDLAAAATTIYVKHNEMTTGDRVYMEANGKVEFFAITNTGTNTGTDYAYTVTRNLDGTGANDWYAGDAIFNTGTTGEGFIDLYSLRGVKAASEYGPAIVGNVRLSTTYNDWAPRWAVGNLNGLYGYGATTYGLAAGSSATAWIAAEATNGFRVMQGSTVRARLDTSGNFNIYNSSGTATITLDSSGASYFSGPMTIGASGGIFQGSGSFATPTTGLKIWSDTSIGRIAGYNGGTIQWYANTDGKLYAAGGNIVLDANGFTLAIGDYQASKEFPYVDIAWVAGSDESGRIGSGELNNVGLYGMRFWAGGAGILQSGNGEFHFISKAGDGSETGLAIIKDGGFAGAGAVSGSSITAVSASVYAGGDSSGSAGYTVLTNGTNTSLSSGTGTVKMSGATSRNSNGWIKLYVGTTAIWVPYWTTITG